MSIERINFTRRWIDNLQPQEQDSPSREKEYSDSQVVGLKLQINKSGRRFFYLRYNINGRKRGIRLGEFGPLSLPDARSLANNIKGQIANGIDPKQERERKREIPTMAQYAESEYLPYARSTKRSANNDESKLKHHILPTFKNYLITEMNTRDIQQYHNRIKSSHCPATANRHLALLHRMFNLAIQWGWLDTNPATGIRKFQENNQRHRYLNQVELSAFLKAIQWEINAIAAAAMAFLLFTGARKQEALDAKWDHIDLDKGIWFIPMCKSGKSRHVILNSVAIGLLQQQSKLPDNPYIFPGKIHGKPLSNPQKAFKRILKVAGITDLRIHDLRHTHASIAINGGATLYEVQHLLGHSHAKTTMRYAHLSDESLRKVSNSISDSLTCLTD